MSMTTTRTAPKLRFQFSLRAMLLVMAIVGFIGGIYLAALRAEQMGLPMFYGERMRTLFGFGGGAWAVKWSRARGLGGWRLVVCGAAFGGVLAAIAYAPLSLPEARGSDIFFLPTRMCGGPNPAPPSVWKIAAEITLHEGLIAGAAIGAATAALSFAPRLMRAMHEVRL